MIESFLTVGQQVLILFILVGVGYILGRAKLVDEKGSRAMSTLVLYAVTPCMTIVSFQRELVVSEMRNFGLVFLIAILVHGATILLSHLLVRHGEDSAQRQLRFATTFSNCGYMAFPLQTALLGTIGVFYGSAYVVVFTVLGWTYGLYLLSGDRKQLSLRAVVLNPGVIGVIIAMILYVGRVTLPHIVSAPLQHLANLNTPLPMIVVGMQLSRADLRRALGNRGGWVSMALRLVAVPLLALGICLALGVDYEVTVAVVIAAGAPAAALLSMFSARLDKDADFSGSIVAFQTLISAITMPLVVGLAQYLAS